MLSQGHNERLTQVGPGTPMGDLLRRYWHPIAGVSEFDAKSTRPVRLFGEAGGKRNRRTSRCGPRGASSCGPMPFILGRIEWRVPIDDENTLCVIWTSSLIPKEQTP